MMCCLLTLFDEVNSTVVNQLPGRYCSCLHSALVVSDNLSRDQ